MAAQFKLRIKVDKPSFILKLLLKLLEVLVIHDSEGGYEIEIVHLGDVTRKMKVLGFIGTHEVSTTVEFDGSPRLKRTSSKFIPSTWR